MHPRPDQSTAELQPNTDPTEGSVMRQNGSVKGIWQAESSMHTQQLYNIRLHGRKSQQQQKEVLQISSQSMPPGIIIFYPLASTATGCSLAVAGPLAAAVLAAVPDRAIATPNACVLKANPRVFSMTVW